MNAKWAAGMGLGLLILSPRVRQLLENFMDSLTNHSAGFERAKQQKEADRLLEVDRQLDDLEATLRANFREILDTIYGHRKRRHRPPAKLRYPLRSRRTPDG